MSMTWNLHAIERTQLRRHHRVDGVGRLKFDFHAGHGRQDRLCRAGLVEALRRTHKRGLRDLLRDGQRPPGRPRVRPRAGPGYGGLEQCEHGPFTHAAVLRRKARGRPELLEPLPHEHVVDDGPLRPRRVPAVPLFEIDEGADRSYVGRSWAISHWRRGEVRPRQVHPDAAQPRRGRRPAPEERQDAAP